MKKFLSIVAFACLVLMGCSSSEKKQPEIEKNDYAFIDDSFKKAEEVYKKALKENTDLNAIPRSVHNDGTIMTGEPGDWTCGFFPGSLWFLYENTHADFWLNNAREWTENLEEVKNKETTHDIGFMIYCSFGNGYRLTKDESYLEIINQASTTLSKRFNPIVGCTKSWNRYKFSEKWEFPVIIDNMMNLEMLMFSFQNTGDSSYYTIATSHANTTMENHFRNDYSSYHVVDYDSLTGEVIQKNTHQGYSDSSSWARGQTWGLYGYTFMYRDTKDTAYLNQAKNIADYIMNNPKIPEDKIPYWDYDDPKPDPAKDVSAAALAASALLDLSQLVEDEKLSTSYLNYATDVLRTLSSKTYFNELEDNHHFLLAHATGNYPRGTEIDKPLSYADYYYLEGLLKLKKLVNK